MQGGRSGLSQEFGLHTRPQAEQSYRSPHDGSGSRTDDEAPNPLCGAAAKWSSKLCAGMLSLHAQHAPPLCAQADCQGHSSVHKMFCESIGKKFAHHA